MDDSLHEFKYAAPNRGGVPQVCPRPNSISPVTDDYTRWSQQRQAFGRSLNAQAVVRAKLAQMIARVESAQSWLENVTHQMNNVCSSLVLSSGHFQFTPFALYLKPRR
jgi:hypothetical protein